VSWSEDFFTKGVGYHDFIEALALVLEKTPSPLKLSEDDTIRLLNLLKSPALRAPSILKKISPSRQEELVKSSTIDPLQYPALYEAE
jgi:hypothetical protein